MRAEAFQRAVTMDEAGGLVDLIRLLESTGSSYCVIGGQGVNADERYLAFLARAAARPVLGLTMRVAAVEDLLDGKIWAANDPGRRASERQKDLADIARLIERYPQLQSRLPASIREKLV